MYKIGILRCGVIQMLSIKVPLHCGSHNLIALLPFTNGSTYVDDHVTWTVHAQHLECCIVGDCCTNSFLARLNGPKLYDCHLQTTRLIDNSAR